MSGNINVLGNKTHLSNAAAVPATISREVLRHRHDFPLSWFDKKICNSKNLRNGVLKNENSIKKYFRIE